MLDARKVIGLLSFTEWFILPAAHRNHLVNFEPQMSRTSNSRDLPTGSLILSHPFDVVVEGGAPRF